MGIYEGWIGGRYKNKRPISNYEKCADVRMFDSSKYIPADNGIINVTNVSIEYVDRFFKFRGWALMWGVCVALPFLFISFKFFNLEVESGFEPL